MSFNPYRGRVPSTARDVRPVLEEFPHGGPERVDGCTGFYQYTGVLKPSSPAWYEHSCDACGEIVHVHGAYYPRVIFQRSDGSPAGVTHADPSGERSPDGAGSDDDPEPPLRPFRDVPDPR